MEAPVSAAVQQQLGGPGMGHVSRIIKARATHIPVKTGLGILTNN